MTEPQSSYPKAIREILAELEHEQWAHWTEYMLNNLTDENITRWKGQTATPYSELSEKEKDSDRKWADLVLEAVALHMAGFQSSPTTAKCGACDETGYIIPNELTCGVCKGTGKNQSSTPTARNLDE